MVRSKLHRKRATGSLLWDLGGAGLEIGIKLFQLLQPQGTGSVSGGWDWVCGRCGSYGFGSQD